MADENKPVRAQHQKPVQRGFRQMPRKEEDAPVNKYYQSISGRYKIVKYLLIVVLVVYAVAMYAVYHSDITYQSLMFLLRDFSTAQSDFSQTLEPVSFDEQENMSFSRFKSDIAVIGNSALDVYNAKGENDQNYSLGYDDPSLVASDKYLIAYNIGEKGYSVFNTITRVGYDEAPGTVEGADVNDRGEYLLVCRSDETKYVICSYNSSLRLNAKYFKNKYVTSAAIGKSDSRVLMASFDSSEGGVTLEVEYYKAGASEPESSYKAAGVFPVRCGFFDDNSYYVICTDRILFFNKNGALVREVMPEVYELSTYSSEGNSLVVSGIRDAIGRNSIISRYSSDGETTYEGELTGRVVSLALSGDKIYALSDSYVFALYPSQPDKTADSVPVPGDSVCVLAYGEDAVLCRRGGISGIVMNSENVDKAE